MDKKLSSLDMLNGLSTAQKKKIVVDKLLERLDNASNERTGRMKGLPILTGELPPEEKPRLARKGEVIKLHGLLYDVMFVNYNTGLVRIKLKKPIGA